MQKNAKKWATTRGHCFLIISRCTILASVFLSLLDDKIIRLHWLRAATIAVVSECHFEVVGQKAEISFQIKLFCWGIKRRVHCGNCEINITYQTRADVCSVRWPLWKPPAADPLFHTVSLSVCDGLELTLRYNQCFFCVRVSVCWQRVY